MQPEFEINLSAFLLFSNIFSAVALLPVLFNIVITIEKSKPLT